MEYLSNQSLDFTHYNSRCVNYENAHLNIDLPVFSIHGNIDDPSRLGGHSCLDLIQEAAFVLQRTDFIYIKVRPILFKKGDRKVALLGTS